jgi:hypothetical protein
MLPGRAARLSKQTGKYLPAAQAAIAIPGLILLVDGVLIPTSLGLAEHGVPQPNTIGYATGAAMLVIAGPLPNRYFGRLMLTNSAVHVPRAGARSVARSPLRRSQRSLP